MRLEKYIHFRPTAAMVDIIVKTMVEVISILGIVTKEIRQGHTSMTFLIDITPKVDLSAEKFLKKLAGRKDVEDAFQRLDKLTPEEVLMVAAETMAVTRDIDDTMKDVDKRLEGVDSKVQNVDETVKDVNEVVKDVNERVKDVDEGVKDVNEGVRNVNEGVKNVNEGVKDVTEGVKDVDGRVRDVDERVKDVDGRVGSVIQGRLFFPSLVPESVLTLYSIRCKGGWSRDSAGV